MKLLNTLVPTISPEIPGCPAMVIERQLVRTVREFCMRTHIWREEIRTMLLRGEDEVSAVPSVGQVVSIWMVMYAPGKWKFVPPHTIRFASKAVDDVSIVVHTVLRPAMTDVEVPAVFLDRYEEALAAGTVALLMRQAGQPWTNPQMALLYDPIYGAGIARARADLVRQGVSGPLRVKGRRFV